MKAFADTDIGLCRSTNQDDFYYSLEPIGNLPNLFMVADGMGGHNGGDIASRCTIETMVSMIQMDLLKTPEQLFHNAFRRANRLVYDKSRQDISLKGMGTTLVAATIVGDELIAANVGDSRLYVIEEDIRQVTQDHSYVEEMVRKGKMERGSREYKEKKNMITRAVGVFSTVQPDYFHVSLSEHSQVLLCTDGLSNMVEDSVILQVLQKEDSAENKVKELIELAKENGGSDNITAMLIDRQGRKYSC